MNKKIKTTTDEFLESLSAKELKKFKEGYKEFALSELILALMEQDEISVQLIKAAKIFYLHSPNSNGVIINSAFLIKYFIIPWFFWRAVKHN